MHRFPSKLSNKSNKSYNQNIQRAARASDTAWKARNGLPSSSSLPALNTKHMAIDHQEELQFQELQQRIQRQRRRRKRRRRRKSKQPVSSNNKDHEHDKAIFDLGKALNKATLRCSTRSTHDSRTHLLDVLAHAMDGVSAAMTPGPTMALLEHVNAAINALLEHDPLDKPLGSINTPSTSTCRTQRKPSHLATTTNRSSRTRSFSRTSQDEPTSVDDTRTKLRCKLAKETLRGAADVLQVVKDSLDNATRIPLHINDWAEDLMTEDLMQAASDNSTTTINTTTDKGGTVTIHC